MAIRVTLECGHTSVLRMHTTPEGYTHDWEIFLRGTDNADIHHYIEKVVFHLHNTFRHPKRVLKEPPFVVKESGYAGFMMPIEVYLKNKDEPKKFQITYDLHLQPNGPPINNVIRHSEVIRNPSDEFRKKLLKGGGVIVSSRDDSLEKSDTKTSTMVGKPKLNGSENKKHRINESKTSNSFHDLFGPPIKTTKLLSDSKKTSQSDKNSIPKPVNVAEKSDKVDKTIKTKESLHKDSRKDKDKVDDKKDKKIRDSSKDQFKSKEKSKRPPSPGSKSHSSPGSKRPASPATLKKASSPLLPSSTKRSASPKLKEKDVKKIAFEKEKEKDKAKSNSKSDTDLSKSDKKKDKKKHKDDRDKDRKDKYKEANKDVKDIAKLMEKKLEKTENKGEKSDKEKYQEYKSSSRDGRKSPKFVKESDKARDDKPMKVDKLEKSSEKSEKIKDGKNDKDRQKHKHKKRDKKDKRDSKDREKKERQQSKEMIEKQSNVSSAPSGNALSMLLTEMSERDSSDSAPSVDDDSLPESKSMITVKKEFEDSVISIVPTETPKPLSPSILLDIKKERSDHGRKDKSKSGRSEDREYRKRKRNKEDEEEIATKKSNRGCSTSPVFIEPVSSSQSPVAMESDYDYVKKEEEDYVDTNKQTMDDIEMNAEQVAPDSTNDTDADINEPLCSPNERVLSQDYILELKDLQQNIMMLEDSDELDKVVALILETGQYELTKKTFDFDLCALDRRTIHRLQQIFMS